MHGNSTNTIIALDELDKLIIIAGAALFLVFIVVCLVCALNPTCCLYKYCLFQYDDNDTNEKVALQPVYGSVYNATAFSEQKGNEKSHQGPSWKPMVPHKESELADWTEAKMADIIEMKRDQSGRNRKWSRTSDYSSSASTISSSVQHKSMLAYSLTFHGEQSKLQVKIIQLGNFRVLEPDGAVAPYIKACIYKIPKQFFSFKIKQPKELIRNYLESEIQTKIQRRTDNPIFNEIFDININSSDISRHVIKFTVCDFDKYTRHVNIGEVIRDLSKVKLSSGTEAVFNDLLMEPQEEDLGELHVALIYLPTAEKLSVIVLKARGLNIMEGLKRNIELYTKITLMYDGRPMKKNKTATKGNDPCPVFNETFVFDVPIYQLDKVYFILAIIEVDKDKDEGRHLIGRLYIGVNFDASAKAQWLEMVQSARKQVACWHRLQS